MIVWCRPARVVGVSEPGDDPSQLRQRAALPLGLTADEFLERGPARLAMLPRGGQLSFAGGGTLPGFRAPRGLGLEVPEAGPGGQRAAGPVMAWLSALWLASKRRRGGSA